MPNEKKRFILLGEAGAGKSTLINVLYNFFNGTINPTDVFSAATQVKLAIPCKYWDDRVVETFADQKLNERNIHDVTISQTMKCHSYSFETPNITFNTFEDNVTMLEGCGLILIVHNIERKIWKSPYEIIDTPGFNDTAGIEFDGNNLNCIEEELRTVQHLNGIIVVINGSIDRVSTAFKNFLYLLRQIWGTTLCNACVGVLTNCDSSSVNINPRLLYSELQINPEKTFYFQNTVFRWNRQRKVTKQLQEDFEDAVESVKMLLSALRKCPPVPTESFLVSPIKLGVIQKCIESSILYLLELVTALIGIELTEEGISASKSEMSRNANRDVYHHIHAVAWQALVVAPTKKSKDKKELKPIHSNRVQDSQHMACNNRKTKESHSDTGHSSPPPPLPPSSEHADCTARSNDTYNRYYNEYDRHVVYRPKNVTVELIVPDGESIARHNNANQECNNLIAKRSRLRDQKQELHDLILSTYETLRQQVSEIRKINKDYDLLEKNSELLRQFKVKTTASPDNQAALKNFYLNIIDILEGK
ncbi:unnamed protein product [Rotaria socialis]